MSHAQLHDAVRYALTRLDDPDAWTSLTFVSCLSGTPATSTQIDFSFKSHERMNIL